MPRQVYKDITFSDAKLDKIEHADRICREYAAMGLDLTLRQLFYRFVAANLLPNKDSAYKQLGVLLNDARMCWRFGTSSCGMSRSRSSRRIEPTSERSGRTTTSPCGGLRRQTMPDINTFLANKLKRGEPVKLYVQPSRYYNAESNEEAEAIRKMESLARVAGVKIEVETETADNGRRCVIGFPKR